MSALARRQAKDFVAIWKVCLPEISGAKILDMTKFTNRNMRKLGELNKIPTPTSMAASETTLSLVNDLFIKYMQRTSSLCSSKENESRRFLQVVQVRQG